MKHFEDYDHFGMNDIPKEKGALISSEWCKAALSLKTANENEYQELLNLNVVYKAYMAKEITENRESIIKMLNELCNSFEQFYKKEEWVCILGM